MRLIFREPLLEFWGVLVMMLLGGSVTAVTVSRQFIYNTWAHSTLPKPSLPLLSSPPWRWQEVIDSSQYLSNYQNGNWLTICFG